MERSRGERFFFLKITIGLSFEGDYDFVLSKALFVGNYAALKSHPLHLAPEKGTKTRVSCFFPQRRRRHSPDRNCHNNTTLRSRELGKTKRKGWEIYCFCHAGKRRQHGFDLLRGRMEGELA